MLNAFMDDCSCIIYYWRIALHDRTMDVFNSIMLFMVFIMEMRGDLMITTKEAIEYLSGRYLVVGSKCNPPEDECKKHNEVVDMAIEALKKNEKSLAKKLYEKLGYSPIGTRKRFYERKKCRRGKNCYEFTHYTYN